MNRKTKETASKNKRKTYMGLLFFIACVLSVLAFPINPLVIFKWVEPLDIKALWYIGWIVWAAGMILVGLTYYYIYIRKTKVLIKHGIYKVIRHPLYLGWILSVFITTILLYPHWIFITAGIPGIVAIYLISIEEERSNIKQFGRSYKSYMKKVPRINLILGFIRILKKNN
jgi:protein-S-isoprenylcysteine O-methyltransferase Ste14